jgi:sulfotransferase
VATFHVLQNLHFISGLPRSGVALLTAILRQNPRFHAATASPVAQVFEAALAGMRSGNGIRGRFDEDQKRAILKGIVEGYYSTIDAPPVVFDTNRLWLSRLSAIRLLYPESRIICCVRNPAWILDSIEALYRRNVFDSPAVFANAAHRATVYARAEALLAHDGELGFALSALSEAYYGADAGAMVLVDYDILAARPRECIDLIYSFIGERPYSHDFEAVAVEDEENGSGERAARGKVEFRPRQTILPPDLFQRFDQLIFWRNPAGSKAFSIVHQPG